MFQPFCKKLNHGLIDFQGYRSVIHIEMYDLFGIIIESAIKKCYYRL